MSHQCGQSCVSKSHHKKSEISPLHKLLKDFYTIVQLVVIAAVNTGIIVQGLCKGASHMPD